MRLFLAIEPDRTTRQQIETGLRQLHEGLGALAGDFRWTRPENLHITLHFLGEIDSGRAREFTSALAPPIVEPPFAAATGVVGAFPARGAPRVIYLGLAEGVEPAVRVYGELARRLSRLGFTSESRPFTPHFTLARARARRGTNVRRIAEVLSNARVPSCAWRVEEVTLFQSDLSGSAPKYEPLLRVPLSAGPPRPDSAD